MINRSFAFRKTNVLDWFREIMAQFDLIRDKKRLRLTQSAGAMEYADGISAEV